jgi:hypothetical protein
MARRTNTPADIASRVASFPDRVLPINDDAAAVLRKRTLTKLYNERPTWLDNAHHELDAAVAAAYGWPEDISTDDALARLLDLNRPHGSKAHCCGEAATSFHTQPRGRACLSGPGCGNSDQGRQRPSGTCGALSWSSRLSGRWASCYG